MNVPNDTLCNICDQPVWSEEEIVYDSEDGEVVSHVMRESNGVAGGGFSSSASNTESLNSSQQDKQLSLDDVQLNACPSMHHFHWDCFLKHNEPENYCPGCHSAIVPPDGSLQLLAVIRNEEGAETDYNIGQTLVEERYYAANPSLRKQDALFEACMCGDESTIFDLVEQEGLDVVNARDLEKGWSALFFAAIGGQFAVVQYLLNKGLDKASTDKFGYVAANYAAEEGHNDIAALLS
ncbi:hypothetical protein V1511DRAFT_498091 [Dipodascopsis uninucleata]